MQPFFEIERDSHECVPRRTAREINRSLPNSRRQRQAKCRIAFTLTVCSALLLGCGEKSNDQVRAPSGEVIAHIGSEEITKPELENEFRWANIPTGKWEDGATIKRVLHQLLTRKYLAQQALIARLDHAPIVLLDIKRSKEQALANDFLQRNSLEKQSAIRPLDIFKYVDSHPMKFAKREFLTVDQINLSLSANPQPIIDATKDLGSIEDIDSKLIEMGILHAKSVGVLNSGDLPEDLFSALQTKKDGIFFARTGSNGIFFKIKNEQPSPLMGEPAQQVARQFVNAEIAKKEMDDAAVAAAGQANFENKYATIMRASEPDKAAPEK